MRAIAMTPEVSALLSAHAPVAVGVSGGKDSHAVAWALAEQLGDYQGPKVLIHSDLGEVEWVDSFPACQRIADRIGWELITCSRKAGGMMSRWESRWKSSERRYCNMETVAVVLPWSTPAMRFCTSELKVDPITSALKKRFGKTPMINVTGVRGEESARRAKQAVCSVVGVKGKLPPGSVEWRPIHGWLLPDVWDAIAESGVEPHEAYNRFGSSRVSCRFCILANEADLRASLTDPAAQAIYARMCNLELASGFAFQGSRWLTSLAPDLVENNGPHRLRMAQMLAYSRTEAQAWIPPHLAFTKGWPHCVPTREESDQLAAMREHICYLYGWESPYVSASSTRRRYEELMELKEKS